MLNKLLTILSSLFLIILGAGLMHSCANIASPSGGEYDVEAPVIKRATPNFNSLNVSTKTIEIEFDENIKIEKPMEKVIITPPQQSFPIIKASGKKAIVELEDSLIANTTYVIDFTDAIVDNNESNPVENFMISFSTGDKLDTLSVSGTVLDANNLEPVSGIYVGIHSNLNDTAFTNERFERISRSDSRGRFTVRGIAAGSYRVFALNDLNRDYMYNDPQEVIAFNDSIIVPSFIPAVKQDTIFNMSDSTKIDTIKTINYTRFLPDDLVLKTFKSDFQRQYLQKHERTDRHKLTVFFAAPTTPPVFRILNPIPADSTWFINESSVNNDTVTLWITDSLIIKNDSIRMEVKYLRTDTTNTNIITTDTLNFTYRQPRQIASKSKDDKEVEPQRFLGVTHNIQSSHEIYKPIRIEFAEPIIAFDTTMIRLTREVDSVKTPVNYKLTRDTTNIRKYVIRTPWVPGGKYMLAVDSATIFSQYGLWNNKIEQNFTVKPMEEYGNMLISISGLPDGEEVFVELLDNQDKPLRRTLVKNNEALFMDLNPGTYYARLFIDKNKDELWTTGNYDEKRQPEEVFYYYGKFEIRAFSDHEESWNLIDRIVTRQKPLEITKNKPEERKRRNPNLEQNNRNQGGQGNRNQGNMNGSNVPNSPSSQNNPYLQR